MASARHAFVPATRYNWISATYALVGATLLVVSFPGTVEPRHQFVALSCLLLAYLTFEVARVRSENPRTWLLDPAVLASIASLGLGYAITNYVFFDPRGDDAARLTTGMDGEQPYFWLAQALRYTILGALSMWLAYRMSTGSVLARLADRIFRIDAMLRKEGRPRWGFVWACIFLGIGARFGQIRLGIFGYSADLERVYELAKIVQILSLLGNLSKLALLVVAFEYFSRPRPRVASILAFLTLYEVLLGFILGFKALVVLPVLVVGAASYVLRGRVHARFALAGAALLVAAILLVEPFRMLRFQNPNFEANSVGELATSVVTAVSILEGAERSTLVESQLSRLGTRMNLVGEAAMAMRFKAEHGLPKDAPAFLSNLLMAPLHAVVPRALWPTKPLENNGLWYSQTVWRSPSLVNSVDMSPIGYLNFAGGALAIVLGFGLLGLTQRFFASLLIGRGIPATVVFLGIASSLVFIQSSFNTLFVDFVRTTPILLIAQRIVYRA